MAETERDKEKILAKAASNIDHDVMQAAILVASATIKAGDTVLLKHLSSLLATFNETAMAIIEQKIQKKN